jgi:hypothetical protein
MDLEGIGRGIIGVWSLHLPRGTEKIHEKTEKAQNSQRPVRDSNRTPPEI